MGRCMVLCDGGWGKCMCVLPELVRLDLGVVGGLDGDSEEVVGGVSCEMGNFTCKYKPMSKNLLLFL